MDASSISTGAEGLKPGDQVLKPDQVGCPPTEATNAKDVWEVPQDIGELTISKLFVHPIKVSFATHRRAPARRRSLYPGFVHRAAEEHCFLK